MSWLDRLLVPKAVQQVTEQHKQAHEQLETNIKQYLNLPGVEGAEQLLRGENPRVLDKPER